METRFHFNIQAQPDDFTCGPTCLQGVYQYWDDPLSLDRVIAEVRPLREGGTLAVLLAQHALKRGYRATMYPYNLLWLDPTWMDLPEAELAAKLTAQRDAVTDTKRRLSCQAHLDYLEQGGRLRFADLTEGLLAYHLGRGVPVLTGLSATWLYRSAREDPRNGADDDVAGSPVGHFVVLCGYDPPSRTVLVADPYLENPIRRGSTYEVPVDRVLNAILLGIVTYDANLLLIEPPTGREIP